MILKQLNSNKSIALCGLFSAQWKPHGALELARLEKHFAKHGFHLVSWYHSCQIGSNPLFFQADCSQGDDIGSLGVDPEPWEVAIGQSWQTFSGGSRYAERAIAYSRKIFETLKPSVYIGWNTLETRFGIPAAVARSMGIPVVCIEAGFLPNSVRFDHEDLSMPRDLSDSVLEGCETYGRNLLDSFENNVKPHDRPSKTVPSVWSKQGLKVLVVGCLDSDLGILGEFDSKNRFLPEFSDSKKVADCLAADSQLSVVFRPHPLWGDRFPGREDITSKVTVSFDNSMDLISEADVVVVAGASKLEGAVILEAKPLVRPGVGFIPCPDIGFTETNPALLADCVQKAYETNNPDQEIRRFACMMGALHKNGWARISPQEDNESEQELDSAIRYALKHVDQASAPAVSTLDLKGLLLRENCHIAEQLSGKLVRAQVLCQPRASLRSKVGGRLRSLKKSFLDSTSKH